MRTINNSGKFVDRVAVRYLARGFNCAESVFKAGQEYLNKTEIPSGIATGFGGGIGGNGSLCGALTGAIMVIGLYYNRDSPDDRPYYRKILRQSGRIMRRFQEINGSVHCKELIGYDLTKPEQVKQFYQDKSKRKICFQCVKNTAKLLVETLENQQ